MTTTQLAQLACDSLTVKTVTELSVADSAMVAHCMNAALRQYFAALPSQYKRRQISSVLRGPQAFSTSNWCVVSDEYGLSMYLNGLSNAANRSFKLDDESNVLNRFVTDRRALFPVISLEESAWDSATAYTAGDKVAHELATYISLQNDSGGHEPGTSGGSAYWALTGTRTGTIYGDVASIQAANWRLIKPPTVIETGFELLPVSESSDYDANAAVVFGATGPGWGAGGISVGQPTYYAIEPVSASVSLARVDESGATVTPSNAAFVIRVRPLPQQDYRVVFEVELDQESYTVRDITTPAVLMVHESHAAGVLLDMLRGQLAKTSLWAGDANSRARAAENSVLAAAWLNDVPTINAPVNSRITTPRYF